jgi:hypothetical protein
MEEDERRALPGLPVRDRVALDLREIQLRVSHPIGSLLPVRGSAWLIIGPDQKRIGASRDERLRIAYACKPAEQQPAARAE